MSAALERSARRPAPASFETDRAVVVIGFVVAAIIASILCVALPDLSKSLGDSDDALRLVMVRDLLHGRGWWDQQVTRLQPPIGVWMQWSRLLDGGIAGLDRLFGLVLAPTSAETLARIVWPLLWLAPAVLSCLFAARSLAPDDARGAGVVACACVLIATSYLIFRQFLPGRIDHHGPQIALCLVAAAGALTRGKDMKGPVIAGAATGLGLAIGLEALVPEAFIGAWIALRFARAASQAKRAAAYAIALAATLTLAFLIQTPPSRWGLSFCDGLGLNLVLAVGVACAGLVAAVAATRSRSLAVRAAAVGLAGLLAAGVFAAVKPACLGGPFAEIDPHIRALWLDRVVEVQPLWTFAASDPRTFAGIITPQIMGLAAIGVLTFVRRRRGELDQQTVFWAALLTLALALGAAAVRMGFYGLWLAPPAMAAFAADVLKRWRRTDLLASVGLGFALSASVPSALLTALVGLFVAPEPRGPPDHCSEPGAYATLARLPPGLVVAETDLGGYIVASTPSFALASPYHRAAWGMLAGSAALIARPDIARSRLEALNADYVLDCARHAHKWRDWPPNSLQRQLDAGKPPSWLIPLSRPGDAIAVYRLTPAPQR